MTGTTITLHTPLNAQLSTFPFTVVYIGGNGSSLTPPASSVSLEVPAGLVNGSNVIFNVSNTPSYLFVDGNILFPGFGYTNASGTLTLDTPPAQYIESVYTTGSAIVETPSGSVNGSNLSFTVSNAPLYIIIDNQTYVQGFGYSYSGGTITVDPTKAPYPTSFIRSVYSVGTGGVETPTGSVGQNTFTVLSTPKYAIIDNLVRFNAYGFTYTVPTVSVSAFITPQAFIRTIY